MEKYHERDRKEVNQCHYRGIAGRHVTFALWKKIVKRHKHDWEKVSEVTVESIAERFQGGLGRFPNMGTWMYERKTVTHLECKCGKTKTIVFAHP